MTGLVEIDRSTRVRRFNAERSAANRRLLLTFFIRLGFFAAATATAGEKYQEKDGKEITKLRWPARGHQPITMFDSITFRA